MSCHSHRYNARGSWVAKPVRSANGPADTAIRTSPAVLAALAQIDRAFGTARPAPMSAANQTRRSVMLTAWSFRRAEPDRPFADCLRGAWKWSKGMARAASSFTAKTRRSDGRVHLSPSLIRSPIARSLTGQRYAGVRDSQAAITTSRLGR